MPFAAHLTAANLSVMAVSETLERTQIITGDSLELAPFELHKEYWQKVFIFPEFTAKKSSGEEYAVKLEPVDTVLMNPPFTKVERGISDYVNMRRYESLVGGEVGLWGHFIRLASDFLVDDGVFGAVIPIAILRGRESERVRGFIFNDWSPKYILKTTRNYGFSEWAEYRDVILIATNKKARSNSRIKFCLIKKDLNALTESEICSLCDEIRNQSSLRSELLDIDSHKLSDVRNRAANMMWFISGIDFRHRDTLVDFVKRFNKHLLPFPENYFREGYRPVPKGVSKYLFLTRSDDASRASQAFLCFVSGDEGKTKINVGTRFDISYSIEKKCLAASLRTSTGLATMNVTEQCDYIATKKYREYTRVLSACGKTEQPSSFWDNLSRELDAVKTNIVVVHRINPFSPNVKMIAFHSETLLAPSNVFNVIQESDNNKAKAVCTLLNSCIFFANFFLLKEETTGRYINIRFYDLYEMILYPKDEQVAALVDIYEKYKDVEFPSLRNQFDENFDERYEEFWDSEESERFQTRLDSALERNISPSPVRLNYDIEVCEALAVNMDEDTLRGIYEMIVSEMIITRRLRSD